jgi:methionine salvage enolase-phosphatase E1
MLTLYFHELRDGHLGVPLCDDASAALAQWTEAGRRVVVLHPWPARITRALLAQGLDADLTRYLTDWLELSTPTNSVALNRLLAQTHLQPTDVTLVTAEAEIATAATAAGFDAVTVQRDAEALSPAPGAVAALTDLLPSS